MMHCSCGEYTCQAPGHLSFSDLERAQNAGPTEFVPLCSIKEPETECHRSGKCTRYRAHLDSSPAEQPGA